MKSIDFVSSMNYNIGSLIDKNCFLILWILNCWVDMVVYDGIEIMCVMPDL